MKVVTQYYKVNDDGIREAAAPPTKRNRRTNAQLEILDGQIIEVLALLWQIFERSGFFGIPATRIA